MTNAHPIEKNIREIDRIFHHFHLKGKKKDLLKALGEFEEQTFQFIEEPALHAVIKWYKNLFFQKAYLFQRAEELLDQALDVIELQTHDFFLRWQVKIYVSLGYVHQAQWNYLDAHFYLELAIEKTNAFPALHKYQGEIYSSLSQVSLLMGRHHQAGNYASLEKKVCSRRYLADPTSNGNSIIYAYALINHSRIRRLMGVLDQDNETHLQTAAEIASRLDNTKCMALCKLETAEFKFAGNHIGRALDMALSLEHEFKKIGMVKESIQAGLLAAKVYEKILDYEPAENKFNEIIKLCRDADLRIEKISADAFYGLGRICYRMAQEQRAYACFRESARIGMVLGIKDIIIRSFEAARIIDKHKAKELLLSNLAYKDATFMKNRLDSSFSPFKNTRTKTRLFASTLFVDIVGFSSLMKGSDESMTIQMVDEFIDRMSLIIYQYNGYIDKFLGDGLMAIFEHGDTLSSREAMNAVCSGIDIYRALRHKNRKLATVYGSDQKIEVRIGISTGEIFAMVLGNYIKKEFTYLGNSVNLASKLERQASNQCMLVDEQTYLQTKDRIISEPDSIVIPGLGPTSVHKVLRLARRNKRPTSPLQEKAPR